MHAMPQREPMIERWSGCGPAEAAACLHGRPWLAWLDSALPGPRYGRWSVVASDPRWTLTARGDELRFDDAAGPRRFRGDPIAALADAVEAELRCAGKQAMELPFVGGAIGYLGFELARHIERLPATTVDDVGAPDLAVGWYDAALLWDHTAGRGWLAGEPSAVAALRERLRGPSGRAPAPAAARGNGLPGTGASLPLRSNFERDDYLAAVARARRYIEAGDIYQVNLSQRFSVPVTVDGFELYGRLRRVSPAPFAAYLDMREWGAPGGIEVLSSSPERLLRADAGPPGAKQWLETRPIKGTRPRGTTLAKDKRQVRALLASAKDAAEHVMIVDLERNDLGRVCEVGSISVPEFAALETFAQVHHLTSTVVGRRRADVGLADLLRAVFPGGSVSGAPKIRALEIIDELEPTVRGVYTGAIGYFSANGRIDLNVAIRTVTLAHGTAHMHVGGAIVHDSDPEAEYAETLDKARGMARALSVRLPDEQPDEQPGDRAVVRSGSASS